MKTRLPILIISAMLASCTSGIYVNKAYLSQHNIDSMTLAVLPADVYYSGKQPRQDDWYAQEQTASHELQAEVQQALLDCKYTHGRRNQQYTVVLIDADTVNKRLLTKMADLRTAWTMPADSVGRMIGADMVIKVRMDRERYMSDKAANWGNAGLFVLNVLTSPRNEPYVPLFGYVKAADFDYEINLIATATGDTISSYRLNPPNRGEITRANKWMAAKSVVFAGN